MNALWLYGAGMQFMLGLAIAFTGTSAGWRLLGLLFFGTSLPLLYWAIKEPSPIPVHCPTCGTILRYEKVKKP